MRNLTITLAAACCFALLSAPAQAGETDVELLVTLGSGEGIILPMDTTDPLAIIEPIDAVDSAEKVAGDCLARVTAAWVPQAEQFAKTNALASLKTVQYCDGMAEYFLNSFKDDVASIASLPPGDPQAKTLYARAEGWRAAACQYVDIGTKNAYAASSQPSRLVRLYCAPLVPKQVEAKGEIQQLMSQSIPDLVDQMRVNQMKSDLIRW